MNIWIQLCAALILLMSHSGVQAAEVAKLSASSTTMAADGGITVHGAGATFPKNAYYKWIMSYFLRNRVLIDYQAVGSGEGIKRIAAGAVDFGGSDAPMKPEQLDENGLVQFPMILGGITVAFNLPGIELEELKLTPSLLTDIYMGRITRWNDPAIAAQNPGLDMPALPISVAYRSDGSGTTWIFTHYLSAVSQQWQAKVGGDKSVKWPTGSGHDGNGGVTKFIKQTPGAIGYVEYSYARSYKLQRAQLQNRDGRFVVPTPESFQLAAQNAGWNSSRGNYVVLVDQPGQFSWPITGVSYILVQRQQTDPLAAIEMFRFFDWCMREGQEAASMMGLVPLSGPVADIARRSWAQVRLPDGTAAWKSNSSLAMTNNPATTRY